MLDVYASLGISNTYLINFKLTIKQTVTRVFKIALSKLLLTGDRLFLTLTFW